MLLARNVAMEKYIESLVTLILAAFSSIFLYLDHGYGNQLNNNKKIDQNFSFFSIKRLSLTNMVVLTPLSITYLHILSILFVLNENDFV
jgi:hypothetical protein